MLRLVLVAALAGSLSAACIDVNGRTLLAGDLAKADPAFAALDPGISFSWAPALGAQRIVAAADFQKWASQYGLRSMTAASACFERSVQDIDPMAVTAAIRTALGSAPGNFQIDVIETCPCKAPKGTLEFDVAGASRPSAAQPEAPVLWRGQVIDSDGVAYPVWARVRVLASLLVVRAAKNLRRQQILAPEDLELVALDTSPLIVPPAASIQSYAGKVMKASLARGAILRPDLVRPAYEVERGSLVAVHVVNGAAQLALTARAETAGNVGQIVTLTNPAGAARFQAIVTGPGHAEVLVSAIRAGASDSSTLALANRSF